MKSHLFFFAFTVLLFSGQIDSIAQSHSEGKEMSILNQKYFDFAADRRSQSPVFNTVKFSANQQDSLALVALYDSTGGPNWTRHSGWLTGPVENWSGTTWNAGRLTEIKMGATGMIGTIPEQLADAEMLEWLWLSDGQLKGPIPASLGSLANLKRLYLFRNQLTGGIPPEFKDLQSLEEIVLWENDLEGPIPVEFFQLSNLRLIDFQTNRFSGSISNDFRQLAKLEVINLGDNQFEGEIPSGFNQLSKLHTVNFGKNQLTGSIPEDLVNLNSTRIIELGDNLLTGPIPNVFADVDSLLLINLRNNNLSGAISLELATRFASIVEGEANCTLGGNSAGLCIPDTADYQALGVNPLCGLPLSTSCVFNVGIETQSELPEPAQLLQNYPNPFSSETSIAFQLKKSVEVKITIVDLQGRDLKSYDLGFMGEGYHSLKINLDELVAGPYFYRLKAGSVDINKLMILKK